MIVNQTHAASFRLRGKIARKAWSANAVAAKARKRIERGEAELPDEPAWTAPVLRKTAYATVSIRIGRESVTFRVMRYDHKRLLALGRVQAASTVGKRVALVLDNLL